MESVLKLYQLLSGPLRYLGQDVRVISDFNTCPIVSGTYRMIFGRDSNVHRWMYRSQVLSERVRTFYDILTEDTKLIIAFEAPQSLFKYCQEKNLPLVDFAFHFIRFGAEYSLMARTNSLSISGLLESVHAHDHTHSIASRFNYAACYKAGQLYDSLPKKSDCRTSVFIMQTRFDRSKFDGAGSIIDDYAVLRESMSSFDYYKPHPSEQRPELEVLLEHRGARRLPDALEIYPLIAARGDTLSFTGISSGLIAEAQLLGCSHSRMIVGFPWRVLGFEAFTRTSAVAEGDYIPITNAMLSQPFWQAVLCQGTIENLPLHETISLKDYWNVAWS